MRWLADECVSPKLVAQLRAAGENVSFVLELTQDASDDEVSVPARDEKRLLLTQDEDFGDRVFRRGESIPGIVFIRIEPEQRSLRWPRLELAINQFGEKLFGRYTVIEEARFRFRSLLPPLL